MVTYDTLVGGERRRHESGPRRERSLLTRPLNSPCCDRRSPDGHDNDPASPRQGDTLPLDVKLTIEIAATSYRSPGSTPAPTTPGPTAWRSWAAAATSTTWPGPASGLVVCDCPSYVSTHEGTCSTCKHGTALVEVGLLDPVNHAPAETGSGIVRKPPRPPRPSTRPTSASPPGSATRSPRALEGGRRRRRLADDPGPAARRDGSMTGPVQAWDRAWSGRS